MKNQNRLFYFGILPALGFQMLGAALYFLWDSSYSEGIYALTKLTLVLWPLLWLKSFRKIVSVKKRSAALSLGLVSGLLMAGLILGAYALGLSPNGEAIAMKMASFSLSSPQLYILFALFLSLLHSLLEEYYWRWFVFNGLQIKFSWTWAAIIGSAAFAGHHYFILSEFFPLWLTLILGTGVGVGGFIWCWIYKKTGSLWSVYLSHVCVDAALMGIGYVILF